MPPSPRVGRMQEPNSRGPRCLTKGRVSSLGRSPRCAGGGAQVQPWFLMDGRARTPGRTQNLSTYANAPRDEPPLKSASRGASILFTGK